MKLYLRFLRMHALGMLQYRSSFVLMSLGGFFSSFLSILSVALLFSRFSALGEWTLGEVALCFSASQMAYALAECLARGFDMFSRMVIGGEFDRLLVRPRGAVFQVFCSQFEFSRVGRLLAALLVLVWAALNAAVGWTAFKTFVLLLMVLGGVALFVGIFILGATMCFFTLQSLEAVNVFTDGGREVTRYPLDIYPRAMMLMLTFVIPYGCMNYLPLLYLTGRTAALPYAFAPLACALFLVPAVLAFRAGMRRYVSAGS